MVTVSVDARKRDRSNLHEPGPLYVGLMATGIRERHDDLRPLEKPVFRTVCQQGIWCDDVIYRYARLYTNGIWPWL